MDQAALSVPQFPLLFYYFFFEDLDALLSTLDDAGLKPRCTARAGQSLVKIALCSQRLPVRHGIREPRACSEAY